MLTRPYGSIMARAVPPVQNKYHANQELHPTPNRVILSGSNIFYLQLPDQIIAQSLLTHDPRMKIQRDGVMA